MTSWGSLQAGGIDYGPFAYPEALTFPGPGVTSFTVTGINPLLDPIDPNFVNDFPIQLDFSQEGVSFDMTPLTATPEPSTFVITWSGMAVAMWSRRRRPLRFVEQPAKRAKRA